LHDGQLRQLEGLGTEVCDAAQIERPRRAGPQHDFRDRIGAGAQRHVPAGDDQMDAVGQEGVDLLAPSRRRDRIGRARDEQGGRIGPKRLEIVGGQDRLGPPRAGRHLIPEAPGAEIATARGGLDFLGADAVGELVAGDSVVQAHRRLGVEPAGRIDRRFGEDVEIAGLGPGEQEGNLPAALARIHHHPHGIGEGPFGQADPGPRSRDGMAYGCANRPPVKAGEHCRKVSSQVRVGAVAGGVGLALLEEPVERPLRRLRMVERHRVVEGDEARQIGASHVLAVGADVHQRCVGAEGTAFQVDLVVAKRLANVVEVVDRGRRRVLREIEALLELAAAGLRDLQGEGRLEVSLEVIVGARHPAIEPMPVARPAGIDEDDVVGPSVRRLHEVLRKFGSRLAGPAGEVEDRGPIRMRAVRR